MAKSFISVGILVVLLKEVPGNFHPELTLNLSVLRPVSIYLRFIQVFDLEGESHCFLVEAENSVQNNLGTLVL